MSNRFFTTAGLCSILVIAHCTRGYRLKPPLFGQSGVDNTHSTLTCEVAPHGANQFDFHLKSP